MDVKLFAKRMRDSLMFCKSSEVLKNFTKKIYSKSQKNRSENYKKINSKGTVLIEFAICMPIFVILLFYTHDLAKYSRTQSCMEFINTQMINVIQNISLKRDNKIITKSDMNHAYVVSHQLVFPGTTLFRKGSGTELIYSSYAMIYYVKGESNGKASCVWVCHMTSSSCTNPTLVQVCAAGDAAYSTVRWGTGVSPEKIHPSLKINEGEVKIIVENTLYWTTGFPDTAGKTYSTAREAFRYHFINPKERSSMYFNAVSIFTPKPGLFDETGPQ